MLRFMLPIAIALYGPIALIAVPHGVRAQAYPTRQVELVVPFAPGGGTDILARIIAEGLTSRLGQRVLVVNRPGANSNIGTQAVVRAVPNGHTLLLTSTGLAANPSLYKPLPFDPEKDLAPIMIVSNNPAVLVVHPKVSAKSLAEFIALLKSEPGKLDYASYGPGSGPHLTAELFQIYSGTQMTMIPYSGGGPATVALVGGHVHAVFAALSPTLPFVSTGRLRPIATAAERRLAALPDLPTFKESGIDLVTGTWLGLLAPAGTPRSIIDRLHTETISVLREPSVTKRLIDDGGEVIASSPEEFARFIATERARWADVVSKSGIK